MANIDHKLADIALDRVPGADFEAFVNAFYPALAGIDFIPTGGLHDGGADGYQDTGLFEGTKPNTFYQASIQQDHRSKVRHTVKRLRKFGRDPKSLVYITSRPISAPDKEEELLSAELDVFVKIRPRNWILGNLNHSNQTQAAFENHLSPQLSFLHNAGAATIIPDSSNIKSRAICVFLGQEVERRRSKSPLIESVTDSLILWALDDTDPDAGKFITRGELQAKIEEMLPTAKHFIRGVLDHRLAALSSKGNPSGREIRHYRKEDKYCLPYETRKLIEAENIEDEYLKVQLCEDFEISAQNIFDGLGITDVPAGVIPNIMLAAIQMAFENSGLELASFLEGNDEADVYPAISDYLDTAIQNCGLNGEAALHAKDVCMQLMRNAFYQSNSNQREYFGKLSRTYALLFSLRADPRIVEYFQSMSSRFVLFVGTDILVRALSEHYLHPDDQMTCNMLKILQDARSELILCAPVLEEVHRHLETTDWEFINYFADQEPYVDLNHARHSGKILIRSYFYARLRSPEGIKGPAGWKSFIGQFCDYKVRIPVKPATQTT